MAKLKTISTEQLQERLKQGNGLHFWNVLTDGYFKGEMIPGSRRVPLNTVGREVSDAQVAEGRRNHRLLRRPNVPAEPASGSKTHRLGLYQREGLRGRP